MANPYVREVGRVEDADQSVIVIGVDYDTVNVTAPGWAAGGVRLTRAQAEEFARLFVAACWEAAANFERMGQGAAVSP